jgi:hypothetical protein
VQQILEKFFIEILARDKDCLNLVAASAGDLFFDDITGSLVFKLPDLHKLLFNSSELDYQSFRKLLYQGNLNEKLLELGARIEIHQTSGKVDDSYYRLVKI